MTECYSDCNNYFVRCDNSLTVFLAFYSTFQRRATVNLDCHERAAKSHVRPSYLDAFRANLQ